MERLGNLMQTLEGKVTHVTDINCTKDYNSSYFWCFGYSQSQVEPIPLTEEWLVKFGFKDNLPWELENLRLDSENRLSIVDSSGYGVIIARNVIHVHTIQNLYHALTGEELTYTKD